MGKLIKKKIRITIIIKSKTSFRDKFLYMQISEPSRTCLEFAGPVRNFPAS